MKEGEVSNFSQSCLSAEVTSMVDEHTQYRAKKIEKKLKKYFAGKLEDIEQMIKKSKRKRSKSPLSRTPVEMSTMSRYEIEQSVLPSTQFRLSDFESGKHEQSTILRDSKNTTISNKNKGGLKEIKKKSKRNKEDESKSRSKSRSQKKDEGKSKTKKEKKRRDLDKSLSCKSRDISYSQNLSDNSLFRSCSRSRSISQSKSNISKSSKPVDLKSKRSKKHRKSISVSKSKSKSNHSCSPSLHDKCKKRP